MKKLKNPLKFIDKKMEQEELMWFGIFVIVFVILIAISQVVF